MEKVFKILRFRIKGGRKMNYRKITKRITIMILLICFFTFISSIYYNVDAASTSVIEISTSDQMWNFAKSVDNGNTYKGVRV